MNNTSGIYKITSPTNRTYIGQSKNIGKRFENYKYAERDYKSFAKQNKNSLILKSLIKHGYNSHKFDVLEFCNEDKLNEREIYYIDKFKTNIRMFPCNRGLNLTIGGDKPPINKGRLQSESTKNSISVKNIEHHLNGKYKNVLKRVIKYDKEGNIIHTYNKLKELYKNEGFGEKFFRNKFYEFNKAFIGNYIFSFEDSCKFKYKIAKRPIIKIKKIKHFLSKEQISKKRSDINLKRKSKDEWKKYFSNLNKGRKHLNRKKPIKSDKMLSHLKIVHEKNKTKVKQYTKDGQLVNTFNSIKEAAAAFNGTPGAIYRACIKKIQVCFGYKWEYAN